MTVEDTTQKTGGVGGSRGASFNNTDILRVNEISKSYGSVQALSNVSFGLETNSILGLIGDNGAGKSTLLKILNGFLTPDSGEIIVDGQEVTFDSPADARRNKIRMTYQDMALVGEAPVWENFFLGREKTESLGPVKTLNKKKMRKIVNERLEDYGIKIDVKSKVSDLSGGERQIISISRAVESDPNILLLDEPFTQLGREGKNRVLEFINELSRATSISIIIVSHDLEVVRSLVDELVILYEAKKTFYGSPSDVSTDDILQYMLSGSLESS